MVWLHLLHVNIYFFTVQFIKTPNPSSAIFIPFLIFSTTFSTTADGYSIILVCRAKNFEVFMNYEGRFQDSILQFQPQNQTTPDSVLTEYIWMKT